RDSSRRDLPEILLNFCEYFVGLNVANDCEDSIVRRVILFIELLNVLDFRGVEIVEIPVEIVSVRVSVEGFARQIDRKEEAVWTIQHVHSYFFFDDVTLVLQILWREIERLQTVGLDPQHGIERRDRGGLYVFGVIVASVAIVYATAAFNDAVENSFG